MAVIFEKSFVRSFTVIADNEPVEISSVDSARIYDATPTDTQLQDHAEAEADETVKATAFSEGIGFQWHVTFPAITNPDPTRQTGGYKRYWIAYSYTADSGGTKRAAVETLYVYYPDALNYRFSAANADVYTLESKIETVKGDSFMEEKIELATVDILDMWQGDGIERSKVKEDDANTLVRYRAAALACWDISSEADDAWERKGDRHHAQFERFYRRLQLRFDENSDRDITPLETATLGPVWAIR